MGSGVVKSQQPQPQQPPPPGNYHSSPQGQYQSPAYTSRGGQPNAEIMACDTCSTNFTFFKRKHLCKECNKYFCSKCMAKEPNRRAAEKRCNTCRILSSPDTFGRNELMTLKIKDLRQYLISNNVPLNSCTEKNDLVELLLRHHANQQNREAQVRAQQNAQNTARMHQFRAQQPQEPQYRPGATGNPHQPQTQPSHTESGEDRTNRLQRRQQEEMRQHEARRMAESPEPPPDTRPSRQRASISDLSTIEEIDDMTIRQLKEVLATNFVDFKGCVEKWELVDRVKRLFREKEDQRQRAEEILKDSGDGTREESSNSSNSSSGELCKICMDAPIDCVLLECGHMITCTKCGKRMSECPICRQYVVRVVHTFKV
ncbi:E3 ubiquitin-protein ligase RNF34-like isoform X2 [Ptychodera flava]|uniref:E3 ubiquitin-protein ligase RNF34-like isoform X2 n=1 Tax=Ptychodera flava TaxID=63121 RepID=UPI00396A16B1